MLTLLLLAATRWMLDHPYGIHADEAWYINEAQTDLHVLHRDGLHALARWLIHGDRSRPPGYRLLVLPFTMLFGYHILMLRLVTFACSLLSGWLIFLTTRHLTDRVAATMAALAFCLSPEVVHNSIFFSTEGPLYLAVAGTLYFLSASWRRVDPDSAGGGQSAGPPVNWIGLGFSLGLGICSKITFASIAGPVLVVSAFLLYRNRQGFSGLLSLAKAGALALVVAVPWWRANIRSALAYAVFGNTGWIRHSLGSTFFATLPRWLDTFFVSLLGPGTGILIALILIVYAYRTVIRAEIVLTVNQRTALLACASAGLPITVVQLLGTNHNLRLISAIMIPLAIAVGVLSEAARWSRSRILMSAYGLLMSAQCLMLIFPVLFPNKHPMDPGSFNGYPWTMMIRFEQWDWESLRHITDSCDIPAPGTSDLDRGSTFNGQGEYGWRNPIGKPRISYMGNGRAFNGSQIQYPWIANGAPPPDVIWLWRYEDGTIDWQRALDAMAHSDIVITAPTYVGQVTDRQDLDNQHNAEFSRRLARDQRFRGPVRLEMGQLDPVEVDVFLRSTLHCHETG
jgi:4-amino-4-deoxy-L-arabinose transferase-like glycosyltransferase